MGENKRIYLQGERETVFERISGGRTFIYEDNKGLIIIGEMINATRNITIDIENVYSNYKEIEINDLDSHKEIKTVLEKLNRLITGKLILKKDASGQEIIQGKEKLKKYVAELPDLEIKNYLGQINRYERATKIANR